MSILESQHDIQGVAELETFWGAFLPHLNDRAVIILSGEVGAGKTTSVQLIAKVWGMKDVQSPSFAIHHRYEAGGRSMDHVDLYRLKDDDDLESSGFWDLFAQESGLVVIEWGQRLDYDYLPLNWQRVEVQIEKTSNEGARRVISRLI